MTTESDEMPVPTPHKCRKCSVYYTTGFFCSTLCPEELVSLNSRSRTLTMRRGDALGDIDLFEWPIVAVVSGMISVQHFLADGRKSISTLFKPGDIVDLRGASKHSYGTLVALGKTELCRLSPDVFNSIISANPTAREIAWDNLRAQTRRAVEHSGDLATKQALERVASSLFEFAGDSAPATGASTIDIPIRRIDLADYLGMQPETLSRCFRDLEARSLIDASENKRVVILDSKALRQIANGDKPSGEMASHDGDTIKVLKFRRGSPNKTALPA